MSVTTYGRYSVLTNKAIKSKVDLEKVEDMKVDDKIKLLRKVLNN